MYSAKNSHHPNNTAPDRITSVAPLLLGAVKDVTSMFYQFRILAVWPLRVTQISGKVRPFTMEWSLGSFRILWHQTTNHIICSKRGIFFDNVRLEPIKLLGEAHWLEVQGAINPSDIFEYFYFGCEIPEMRISCQYSLSQ